MWYPTNKTNTAVAKIAEKDIPIIKVGISEDINFFTSCFQKSCYKLNCPVPRVRIQPLSTGAIAEGYHFLKPNMIDIDVDRVVTLMGTVPAVNIHCRFEKQHLVLYFNHERLVIVKGIIPKGTIYYLNANGEGVAERIVLTEITKV